MAALADLTEISSPGRGCGDRRRRRERSSPRRPPTTRARERLARTALDLLAAAPRRPVATHARSRSSRWRSAEGSVFVAREGGRSIVATTSAAPDVRPRLLRPADLPALARRAAAEADAEGEAEAEGEDGPGAGGRPGCVGRSALLVLLAGLILYLLRRREQRRERVHLHYDDGSTVTLERAHRRRERLLALARGALVSSDELGARLREHALLEGDFVLRSGKRSSWYLDKYRFETQPDLLGPLGERLAAAVREFEPGATRLAGPALGAVALAASASLASGLPFVIVRERAKEYGTANRLEGLFEAGELVCLLEDVVTSGGALGGGGGRPAGGRARRPERRLRRRPRGGGRRRARPAWASGSAPLYRAGELVPAAKTAANPHG